MFWTLYDDGYKHLAEDLKDHERSSGFINNDSYFMTGEEQYTYPVLIHKVNIPPEW